MNNLREILSNFNQNLLQKTQHGKQRQDKNQGESAASEGAMGDLTSPWDARHTNHDLSWERKARDTALAKQVAEAVVDGQGSCALPGFTQ